MRQENILLVSPKFRDTFWSFLWALWFVAKAAAFMPYGLLIVAALIKMFNKNWNIKLVDMNVERLRPRDIRRAKYVCIGAMGSQMESLIEVIALCNKFGVPVIMGGPILESSASCDNFPGVSHFVVGKAEEVLPQLLADLRNGCAKRIYTAPRIPPIELTPVPLYELAKLKKYGSATVQFSRGCPYGCDYCSEAVIDGEHWCSKSVQRFLEELDALYDAGYRGPVQICDANFAGNFKKVKEMLLQLVAWQVKHKFPFRFTIEAAAVIASDQKLLELMVSAGVDAVFLGLETNKQACLKECNKLQNLGRNMVQDAHIILGYGMHVYSGILTGFDNDDPKTFADEQIKFVIDSCLSVAMVGALQAQPGTALFEKKKDLLLYNAENNTGYGTNFKPAMEMAVLEAETKRIVETINSWPVVCQRICNVLEKLDVSRRPPKKLRYADLRAVFRSVLRIGIFGGKEARRCYWTVLQTAFSKHRAKFPEAVRLLIYAWHLHKSERC